MLYIPDMRNRSLQDDLLDNVTYAQETDRFTTTQLGQLNQQAFDEWKRFYQKFPGFVGFIVKIASEHGYRIEHIPYMVFKNYYEHLLTVGSGGKGGPIAIEDYWRKPLDRIEDCWAVASGAQFYANKFGGTQTHENAYNTSLYRYIVANKKLSV